jgi:hypothetical protein
LTLYVSNQSFADPNVQIAISIDGVVVVDQRSLWRTSTTGSLSNPMCHQAITP